MKDIMLKITGRTLYAAPKVDNAPNYEDEKIEFITSGTMRSRGGITRISYDETELSGMEGCKTDITISGDRLKMQRTGKDLNGGVVMEFEEGKRYEGKYETPMGNLVLEILTNKIDMKDKKVSIDYSLSLQGLMESRNKLDIEVIEQ